MLSKQYWNLGALFYSQASFLSFLWESETSIFINRSKKCLITLRTTYQGKEQRWWDNFSLTKTLQDVTQVPMNVGGLIHGWVYSRTAKSCWCSSKQSILLDGEDIVCNACLRFNRRWLQCMGDVSLSFSLHRSLWTKNSEKSHDLQKCFTHLHGFWFYWQENDLGYSWMYEDVTGMEYNRLSHWIELPSRTNSRP